METAKTIFAIAVIAFIVFALLHIVTNYGGTLPPGGGSSAGTLAGRVSIGPFCPVQRLNQTCGPADVYSSRSLVLTAPLSPTIYVQLASDGSFNTRVPQNTYSVTITNCTFLGCRYALPRSVTVLAGQTSVLNITIDTGIR